MFAQGRNRGVPTDPELASDPSDAVRVLAGVHHVRAHDEAVHVEQRSREALAFHETGRSDGPTEGINLLIKKVKRVGRGFRNFGNYRLRLLLHCGVTWHTVPTARVRGRRPRFIA